jgi:hypothetical protein
MREIWSARAEGKPYGLVINMGIAGSYDLDEFPIASAAIISKEYFGDLGFDTDKGFADLFRCGIIGKDEFPYTGGALAHQLLPTAILRMPYPGIKVELALPYNVLPEMLHV